MVFVVANKCFLKKRQTKEEEDKACLQKTSYAVNITIVIFSLIAGKDHQMGLNRLLRPVPYRTKPRCQCYPDKRSYWSDYHVCSRKIPASKHSVDCFQSQCWNVTWTCAFGKISRLKSADFFFVLRLLWQL